MRSARPSPTMTVARRSVVRVATSSTRSYARSSMKSRNDIYDLDIGYAIARHAGQNVSPHHVSLRDLLAMQKISVHETHWPWPWDICQGVAAASRPAVVSVDPTRPVARSRLR